MTRYLLLGTGGGESKSRKAKEFKTEIIDEDDLLKLIETLPEQKPPKNIQPKNLPKLNIVPNLQRRSSITMPTMPDLPKTKTKTKKTTTTMNKQTPSAPKVCVVFYLNP